MMKKHSGWGVPYVCIRACGSPLCGEMNARRRGGLCVVILVLTWICFPAICRGFSPYENYLASGEPTHVGLLAKAKRGQVEDLREGIQLLNDSGNRAELSGHGIDVLRVYQRVIGEDHYFVVYFVFEAGREYLKAAEVFAGSAPVVGLAEYIEDGSRGWRQMEWINYIRGKNVPGPARSELMIVTTIRPEKEMEYRTLHQTVWPGVVDQLVRSNNRNLSIFLTEIDERLVEFLYLEYVGNEPVADEAMSKSNRVNQRWWRLTDACQEALPGVESGIWDLMEEVGGG